MKQITVSIMAAAFLAISSCTPGGGTTTPTTPALNSTETSLKGKWYLIKEEQDYSSSAGHDTVLTTTSSSVYMDLLSDSYSGGASGVPDNYKKVTDARLGIFGTPVSGVGYWFYDEAANRLTITGHQWEKVSQTSTLLVIKKTDINLTITETFKK